MVRKGGRLVKGKLSVELGKVKISQEYTNTEYIKVASVPATETQDHITSIANVFKITHIRAGFSEDTGDAGSYLVLVHQDAGGIITEIEDRTTGTQPEKTYADVELYSKAHDLVLYTGSIGIRYYNAGGGSHGAKTFFFGLKVA